MRTSIARVGWNKHRVLCSHCGFARTYEDAQVSDAISDYQSHDCNDTLRQP